MVEAARLLGLDTIRLLVSSTEAFCQFEVDDLPWGWLEVLTQRSLAVARTATEIARAETDDAEVAGDALLAGILHDVGMLVLVQDAPQRYLDVLAVSCGEGVPLWQLEKEQFNADHAEIGAYLMALWGLPDPIVDGIGSHHCPSLSSHHGFCPLTAVHVAEALVGKEAGGRLGAHTPIDMDYLDGIGLADRLDTWQQICRATSPERALRRALPSFLRTLLGGILSGNNAAETTP
ncbi:MAG: hypothetical protein A2V70_20115 [Planctomycetes bacterium RBG_13_63_9]|nr:MAG: hypothetical protein A2V70_20115 [Planctomycetes bacterium RBG_13_63_9]